jgi:hypothetical protein
MKEFRVKRQYVSTRQHGVISQKTLTLIVTAVELKKTSQIFCFCFTFFYFFFPLFLVFCFYVFFPLIRLCPCFFYCLFPSSLVFLFYYPLSLLFALYACCFLTRTFLYADFQQAVALPNDRCCFVCVMTFCVYCQLLLSGTCVIVALSVEGCGIGNIYSNMYCRHEQHLRCMGTACLQFCGFDCELALFLRLLNALSCQMRSFCCLSEVGG